jgi:hypothetical protein
MHTEAWRQKLAGKQNEAKVKEGRQAETGRPTDRSRQR